MPLIAGFDARAYEAKANAPIQLGWHTAYVEDWEVVTKPDGWHQYVRIRLHLMEQDRKLTVFMHTRSRSVRYSAQALRRFEELVMACPEAAMQPAAAGQFSTDEEGRYRYRLQKLGRNPIRAHVVAGSGSMEYDVDHYAQAGDHSPQKPPTWDGRGRSL